MHAVDLNLPGSLYEKYQWYENTTFYFVLSQAFLMREILPLML